MSDDSTVASSARALAAEFDRSFASLPTTATAAVDDFLMIRIGGDPYAIRLGEILGLAAERPIIPVPSAQGDLLGVAGIRGGIVPVFALTSLLDYGSDPRPPRWLILCATDGTIALGFSEFEGHLRLPRLATAAGDASEKSGLREIINTGAGARAVLSIPLVVATIRHRRGHSRPARSNDT